jgi:hypothetical protein
MTASGRKRTFASSGGPGCASLGALRQLAPDAFGYYEQIQLLSRAQALLRCLNDANRAVGLNPFRSATYVKAPSWGLYVFD